MKRRIRNQLTKINTTNMTKVSVFGQQPTETKELKKIEFVKYLHDNGELMDVECTQLPKNWQNVQLFCTGEFDFYDTILAWDDNQKTKCIFLGHWNDGVV